MKTCAFVMLSLVLFTSSLQAQTKKVEAVNSWGAVFIPSDAYFWKAAEKQLLPLVGEEKLRDIKTNSILCNWPYGLFETDDMLDDEYEAWEIQMNHLRFETVTSIKVGAITYYLLELPYNKNLNWDKRYFWKNSLFFFFQDKYLKLSN